MTAQIQAALTILRRKQVEARTGLSRSTIYAKLKPSANRPGDFDASFPKAVRLGPMSVGWLEHEVEAWLAGRVQASREVAK